MSNSFISHWSMRVRERCPEGTDPDKLFEDVRNAALYDTTGKRIEKTCVRNWLVDRSVWRYRLDDGTVVYPILDDKDNAPVTILTQSQYRNLKRAKRLGKNYQKLELMDLEAWLAEDYRQSCIRRRKEG